MATRTETESRPSHVASPWSAAGLWLDLNRIEGTPDSRQVPGLLTALVTTGIAGLLAFIVSPTLAGTRWGGDIALGLGVLVVVFILVRLALVTTFRGAWICLAASTALTLAAPSRIGVNTALGIEPATDATHMAMLIGAFVLGMTGVYLLGRSIGMSVGLWLDGLLAGAGGSALVTLGALTHPAKVHSHEALTLAETVTAQGLLMGGLLALGAATGWRRQGVWLVPFAFHFVSLTVHAGLYFGHLGDHHQIAAAGRLSWYLTLAGTLLAAYCTDPYPEAKPNARRAALSTAILPLVGLIATAAVLTLLVFRGHTYESAALFPAFTASTLATLRISQAIRGAEEFRILSNIATTDELTGLANRRQLYHSIEELLYRHADSSHALMLMDLNAFKEVNDTLGHPVGDALLVDLGKRLSDTLPDGAMLARLGGDEFAVLLPFATPSSPGSVAQDIRTALRSPFIIQGVRLQVGCSIGSARYPVDGANAIELLSRADIAMYHAKRGGRGYQRYQPELESDTLNKLELLADLETALTEGQFETVYQPKMEISTGRIVSVEALVRWRHPERGLLSPGVFLDLVEQTGALPALTSVVLDQALTVAAQWRSEGFDISVAVNVGSGDLLDDQLVDGLLERLARHQMPPRMCIVEVTEGAFIEAEPSERIVRRLHNSGIPVAIDDYGAGYSSLSRLRALQATHLKLDRSLIAAMRDDPGAAAVVRSSIGLAHTLDMRLTAEGVEDTFTLNMLSELGCDEVQGYLIARPMPAPILMEWLHARIHTPAGRQAGV